MIIDMGCECGRAVLALYPLSALYTDDGDGFDNPEIEEVLRN